MDYELERSRALAHTHTRNLSAGRRFSLGRAFLFRGDVRVLVAVRWLAEERSGSGLRVRL